MRSLTAATIPAAHDGLHDHQRERVFVCPRRPLERQRKVGLGLFRVDHSLVSSGEHSRVGLFMQQELIRTAGATTITRFRGVA